MNERNRNVRQFRIFPVILLLALAGCNEEELLSLPPGSGDPETSLKKVIVVGDSASPKLADFLTGKGFDVLDVPYVAYEASNIQADGDYIVWSDDRNGDLDVYAYQISTATEFAISTATGDQTNPQISGDYVVWQDYRSGNADIYAYNLVTEIEIVVTTALKNQLYPQIDGDYIVWQDQQGTTAAIYGYQISAATVFPINDGAGEQWLPKISGDYVVWQRYENGYSDIYGYRISSPGEFPISTATGSQFQPVISGDYVAWVDNRNGDDDIYFYKISVPITDGVAAVTAIGQQTLPQISGEHLVWQDKRNGNDDIFAFNFSTGEIVVSNIASQQVAPRIDGDYIVWQDDRNSHNDIYAYQISTGIETRITSDTAEQTLPVIKDGVIAWLDKRRGVTDVMLSTDLGANSKLATNTWHTPAGVADLLTGYDAMVLGSDIPSGTVMVDIFDAADVANINVYALGGTGTSLASSLAAASRFGISTNPMSGCSSMELVVPAATVNHALFETYDVSSTIAFEKNTAVTMDELQITTNAADLSSPADWTVLANFSGNMCNASGDAIVEFTTGNGTKVVLDGAANVADEYLYWTNTRWGVFNNALDYLTTPTTP